VVDGPSDGSQIVGVPIREGLHDHVQRFADRGASAGDGATSEVEREGHGVAAWHAVRSFDAGGPLHLSLDSVRAFNHFPHHGSNIRCSLSERPGSVFQVAQLVGDDGRVPCGWPVVVGDVRMRNDTVGVEMVSKVIANRQVNPIA